MLLPTAGMWLNKQLLTCSNAASLVTSCIRYATALKPNDDSQHRRLVSGRYAPLMPLLLSPVVLGAEGSIGGAWQRQCSCQVGEVHKGRSVGAHRCQSRLLCELSNRSLILAS